MAAPVFNLKFSQWRQNPHITDKLFYFGAPRHTRTHAHTHILKWSFHNPNLLPCLWCAPPKAPVISGLQYALSQTHISHLLAQQGGQGSHSLFQWHFVFAISCHLNRFCLILGRKKGFKVFFFRCFRLSICQRHLWPTAPFWQCVKAPSSHQRTYSAAEFSSQLLLSLHLALLRVS